MCGSSSSSTVPAARGDGQVVPALHLCSSQSSRPPPSPVTQQQQQQLQRRPLHISRPASLLSSELIRLLHQSGVVNLVFMILASANFRLILENMMKYGLRFNRFSLLPDAITPCGDTPAGSVLIRCGLLFAERTGHRTICCQFAGHGRYRGSCQDKSSLGYIPMYGSLARQSARGEWVLFWLNAANTTAAVALPWAVIFTTKAEPLSAAVLICLAVVLWMKLVSFHHCCADLRQARRQGEVRPGERGSPGSPAEWALLAYPENLTLSHLAYFLAAPTLSYQVNYPRTGTIRKKWLARRVGELVVMLTVLSLIVAQYVQPAVANSMGPLMQMDWLHIVERVLKLALPNMYCWLVMFYCVFHLWLNILAELLRFGDREFYKDWWNSSDVGSYWKQWNLPVHKWLLRHVYFPALRLGLSRWPAMILVFFVSAVFHELVLGVPLHMVRLWAFSGIMLQVPLVILTDYARKKLNRDEAGNIVFWLSFCVVGQPLTLLLYSHDYLYEVKPHLMATQAVNTSSGIVI
nr:acyl-CoA: diacylglycerol acyltransferase [Haematococcus lacustris]